MIRLNPRRPSPDYPAPPLHVTRSRHPRENWPLSCRPLRPPSLMVYVRAPRLVFVFLGFNFGFQHCPTGCPLSFRLAPPPPFASFGPFFFFYSLPLASGETHFSRWAEPPLFAPLVELPEPPSNMSRGRPTFGPAVFSPSPLPSFPPSIFPSLVLFICLPPSSCLPSYYQPAAFSLKASFLLPDSRHDFPGLLVSAWPLFPSFSVFSFHIRPTSFPSF